MHSLAITPVDVHDVHIGPTTETVLERAGPELSIIVPTFNKRNNLLPLINELSGILAAIDWEVIFVDDDSSDGTAKAVRHLGRERARVRCVQRINRKGLSSACVEGMLASSAPYVAVMDGDLQHDSSIIPTMLGLLKTSGTELVVGSRYVAGGGTANSSKSRSFISRFATRLGYAVAPAALSDPTSGFFMLRRTLLDDVVHNLSCLGFRILLDILASARRPVAFREVPLVFRLRKSVGSKLDSQVTWEYLMLLADKLVGRYIPIRFLSFGLVGSLGVGLHLALLTIGYRVMRFDFVAAQAVAAGLTMVSNYALNNVLTYRDKRRHGIRWLTGLASFLVVCSFGAVANVGVAAYLFGRQSQWIVAAIAGVLVAAVWNYAVSSAYTWGRPDHS